MKIIKGEKILLRPREMKDATFIFKWYRDKDLMMYYGHEKYRVTLEEEKKHVRSLKKKDSGEESFMIETYDGQVLGTIGIDKNKCNKNVELYVMVGEKSAQGKGYAQEAMNLLINYVFKKNIYNRIELNVSRPYRRAINLYEKLGFKKEGIKRQAGWNKITKEFEDIVVMSMLRSEYKK